MPIQANPSIYCLSSAVFCSFFLVLAPSGVAVAGPAETAVRSQAADPYEMILCGSSGTFRLDVSAKAMTMIEMPAGLLAKSIADGASGAFAFDMKKHKLYFSVVANTPVGTETSIRLVLAGGWEATIQAQVVDGLPVEDNVLLYHQSEREKLGLSGRPNPCEPEPHDVNRLIARAAERHDRTAVTRALPVVEQVSKSGNALHMSLLLAEWEHGDMVVDFEAMNPDVQLSRLTGLEVLDRLGNPVAAELLYPRVAKDAAELAAVDGHGRMTGSILLPGAAMRDIGAMEFRFRGVSGASPYFIAVQVVRFRPITEDETERGIRARQVSVSVRALGGGYWMGAGEPSIQLASEGTSMAGLGVRVTKGISSLIAFEGELVGGRTGEVDFANVTWDGMTGDVTRRASFGRAQGAGVIRFGERYVTSMRLGVGVQVANYSSTMTAGGASVDGPGDGVEVDGLWSVGAGFDIRAGEHWTVGTGLNFSNFVRTGDGALEAGIHAGYRWSLAGEDGTLGL